MNENNGRGDTLLSRRLRPGFGAMIVLTVIVGGVAIAATFMAAAALDRAQAAETEAALINDVRHNLLEARRRETNFLLGYPDDYDAAYQEHVIANQEHMQALTTTVEQLKTGQNAMRQGLSSSALTYNTVFLFVAQQVEVRGSLEGNVRDAAHDIEAGLEAANDPQLDLAMLTVRAIEKDYLLGGTEEDASTARDAVDDLRAAITRSDALSNSQEQELLTQVRAYQIDFEELVAIERDIDASIAEVRDVAHVMGAVVDELAAEGLAAQAQAAGQLENILGVSRILNIVLLVVAVTIGARLAVSAIPDSVPQLDGG